MLAPRRYVHFVFGVIQSGLTSLVASGVASIGVLDDGTFLRNWMFSWVTAWLLMLPIVLLAAPLIRALAYRLTYE